MAPFGASSSLQDAPARSAHHPQTGRCWLRRQRSRLRPGVFARLLCATHSQPRGAAPLYLRSTERSAGVRAVHRRAHRRKADHGSLERRLALRDLDPHRNGQRFAPPQAPGSLSRPEWPGAGPSRNRTDRAHAVHARLARAARTAAAGDRGTQQGRSANALARAVCFHRLGRLRDRAVEAQQYRASGLALVTAAIALWNTVYLDRALDDLRCSRK